MNNTRLKNAGIMMLIMAIMVFSSPLHSMNLGNKLTALKSNLSTLKNKLETLKSNLVKLKQSFEPKKPDIASPIPDRPAEHDKYKTEGHKIVYTGTITEVVEVDELLPKTLPRNQEEINLCLKKLFDLHCYGIIQAILEMLAQSLPHIAEIWNNQLFAYIDQLSREEIEQHFAYPYHPEGLTKTALRLVFARKFRDQLDNDTKWITAFGLIGGEYIKFDVFETMNQQPIALHLLLDGFFKYQSPGFHFDRFNKEIFNELPEKAKNKIKRLYIDFFPGDSFGDSFEKIFKLNNLEELYINHASFIKSIPKEIGMLSKLKKLAIQDAHFASLPKEIGMLKNLITLDLANISQKTDVTLNIPKEIGMLKRLKSLNLSLNNIRDLPTELGNLINLRSINVQENNIRTLPIEIGRLVNLEEFDISYNVLESIPKEIATLSNLKSLKVSGNNLKNLPPEIGQLGNLKRLDVSDNQLTSIPPAIGKLTSLQELDLKSNQLISIPKEIEDLPALNSDSRDFIKSINGSHSLLHKAKK